MTQSANSPKPRKKKPEKVWGFTVASFCALMAVFVTKYLVDFLLLPWLFPQFYPVSGAAFLLWLATTLVAVLISMFFITRFGYFYPVANLLYVIIAAIWPLGLYGLGDFWPALIGAAAGGLVMYVIERLILWVFILVGFMRM